MLDQLHPGPLEYKSSRVGTRDKDVPRSTSREMRAEPALPSQLPTSTERGTKGAQFSNVPHSPSLE